MKKDAKLYWTLFTSTLSLSAFTFGGGYVIVPLMKDKFVDDLHWIEEKEILNLVAIGQSAPGPIVINASIILGYRIGGVLGSIVALLGTTLPPLMIISIIASFYQSFRDNVVVGAVLKGMSAGVAAVIASVVITMASNVIKEKNLLSNLIMVGAFLATFAFNLNVMYVIIVCAIIGAFRISNLFKKVKGDPS